MRNPGSALINLLNEFFSNASLRRLWKKIRVVVGVALLLAVLPLIRMDWFWIGFGISMFGELIQLWCFASLKKQKELACNGLYVLVRNPMYLGRYFIVLGLVLLLGMPGMYAVLPLTILYGFYMYNRVRREEKTLRGVLGEPYAAYCRTVNRFLPSLEGRHMGTVHFWKWDLLAENHGWSNLAGLLGAYAVFYLSSYLFSR